MGSGPVTLKSYLIYNTFSVDTFPQIFFSVNRHLANCGAVGLISEACLGNTYATSTKNISIYVCKEGMFFAVLEVEMQIHR